MKSIKILFVALLAATTTSCMGDWSFGQVNGNGDVVVDERNVGSFDGVKGSAGLDVYLTEGDEEKVVVEADENLQEIITTEVVGGVLKVSAEKSIGRAKAKKVHVTYRKLSSVAASSGADVIGNSLIEAESISLDSSSGADLEVEVVAREVFLECSSGADIKVSGRTDNLVASASSGSDIKARDLESRTCSANASSGADITVNVRERLNGKASSGGDIKYYGDPEAVSAKDGYSGSVRKM